jgi:hypothetical protein
MKDKKCTRCGEWKEKSDFGNDPHLKSGLKSACKVCIAIYVKKHYAEHKVEIAAKVKEYNKCNREKKTKQQREYRRKNPEKVKECKRVWNAKNHDKILEQQKERISRWRKENPVYIIKANLRGKMNKVVKRGTKSAHTLELLGCTAEELKVYIENLFSEGMTWDNYNFDTWHIDHIRPCASFDLTDPEQQRECFNYKNLQPLWAKDNLRKGTKWEKISSVSSN